MQKVLVKHAMQPAQHVVARLVLTALRVEALIYTFTWILAQALFRLVLTVMLPICVIRAE